MAKKYSLALIPVSNIADEYLLGDRSLPHVTLYQFQAEEKEIDHVWGQVCDAWKEKPVVLAFNKFSSVTFDNNIFWVSLLPGGNKFSKEDKVDHIDICK